MIVWGITENEIYKAANTVGVRIYYLRKQGKGLRFTLKLNDSKKWQRTSASYFNQTKDGNPRRIGSVCWHGHYHFMRELFRVNENARVKTSWADYRSLSEFLKLAPMTGYKNIGSMMYPIQAREACNCWQDGSDYIMVESVTEHAHTYTMRQDDMRHCPHCIFSADHYRSDGSCRCDDPTEQARLITEYDYTPAHFENPGIEAGIAMAKRLMEGDPETFKAGYTLENAIIAVADVYGFNRETLEIALVESLNVV